MGARAMGLANAASSANDEWSIVNNVGGLAKAESMTTAFSHYAIPSFKPFNRLALAFSMPFKVGVGAASWFRFGDDLYNEQILSLGYANKFGLASLGLKINYVQYYAEGFGSASAFTVSFGGLAELTPKLSVGAVAENMNQPRLSYNSEERIPARFKIGTLLTLSEKVLAVLEVDKDSENGPIAKAGVEYQVNKKLFARTGFNMSPQSAFGGLGFRLRKFTLDYAFQFHEYFGAAHQASVIARIKNKSK